MDFYNRPLNPLEQMKLNDFERRENALNSFCQATGQTYRPAIRDTTLPTIDMQIRAAEAQRNLAIDYQRNQRLSGF